MRTGGARRGGRGGRRGGNLGTWKPAPRRLPGFQLFSFPRRHLADPPGARRVGPGVTLAPVPPRTRSGRAGRRRGAGTPMGPGRGSPASRGSRVQMALARIAACDAIDAAVYHRVRAVPSASGGIPQRLL